MPWVDILAKGTYEWEDGTAVMVVSDDTLEQLRQTRCPIEIYRNFARGHIDGMVQALRVQDGVLQGYIAARPNPDMQYAASILTPVSPWGPRLDCVGAVTEKLQPKEASSE